MAAANADVGLAYAAFYPRVMLNGLAGFQSIDASTLFNWESRVWSVGPSLSLPIFTGGRNRAQLAAARAAYDAAVANYRQTVLSAFQDVEDQLAAQRLLAQQSEKESAALKSARRTLDISMTKYKGGVITYLEVVIAQSAALALEQTVVQLSAQRLAASVSLIKALGAGWTADTGQVAASGRRMPPGVGAQSCASPNCRRRAETAQLPARRLLQRRKQVLQILPVLPRVGGHDLRRVAQGATFHHHRPVEARLLQFGEHRPEIHLARAELEPDRAVLLRRNPWRRSR